MAYRRRSAWANQFSQEVPRKVSVSITWDLLTNAAYRVNFTNIGNHWSKCELVITVIKTTIPTSQREYDPETKTWYIGEAYIKGIKDICDTIPDFEVVYTAKPDSTTAAAMYTHEAQRADYAEFQRMLSFAHVPWTDTTDYAVAKRAYLRASMQLHPDKNPHMANEMSTLNATWSRLTDPKHSYFKKKEEQTCQTVTS